MGLGGCYGCIKYLMFAFNFLFWLLGCAILGCGVWIRVDPEFEKYVSNSHTFAAPLYVGAYMLIGVGVGMMLVGFLGCCGAIRESQIMLVLFFVLLFLIFAVLVVFGVWSIMSKDTLRAKVTEALQKGARDYPEKESARELMDHVQTQFDCCGADNGLGDYPNNEDRPPTCKFPNFAKPCSEEVFVFFRGHLVIIAGVAIGIGAVMLLGMVFSIMLCCAIREASIYM